MAISPRRYAIQGAKIVLGTGTTIEKGTVVVRRGLIEAVGEADKVAVPYDAEVIDGKGLVVYPGFIDLFTTLGQPAGVNRSADRPGAAGQCAATTCWRDAAGQSQWPDARVRGGLACSP